MEKICKKCGVRKTMECFRKRTDTGKYRGVCKDCQKKRSRERYRKSYKQKNKYNRQLIKCEICGYEAVRLTSHLHFEHNVKPIEYKEKYGLPVVSPMTEEMVDEYRKASKRSVKYWTERGYTDEESIEMVSEHQSTFSLEKCVEKYGEESGRLVWGERQRRWQETIQSKGEEELREMNKKKASFGRVWEKDGEDFLEEYRRRIGYTRGNKDGGVTLELMERCNTVEDLIRELPKLVHYNKVRHYINVVGIRKYFGINEDNEEQIRRRIIGEYPFEVIDRDVGRYGQMVRYEGVVYRSMGEVDVARFLHEEGIDFLYERKYPVGGQRYLYDFYLPKYDFYIEYIGLYSKGNITNYNKNLIKKKEMCLENDISCVFSKDIEEIKRVIMEKVKSDG